MPTAYDNGARRISSAGVAGVIRAWNPQRAVIERVSYRPTDGRSRLLGFGYGAGIIEGVCAMAGVAMAFEDPASWKRAMKVTSDKGTSRLMAQRLWPKHAAALARGKGAGRAEAALIGFYGRRHWTALGTRREIAA